jgi:Mg-chelatase subunit ChlD
MKSPCRNNEKGSVSVIFLLTLVFVLIPLTGLAIDATILYVVKLKLSAAVDAAALAAGRSLSVGQDLNSQKTSATNTAQAYFTANFPNNFWNAVATAQVTVSQTSAVLRTVTVQGQATVPTIFMQVLGVPSAVLSDSGQASRRNTNLILVLDRSGSMQTAGVCGTMIADAQSFVGRFANGSDTLGLITFGGSANVDYTPNQNFDASPSLTSKLGSLQCTGATGSAEALSMAHAQIQSLNQPGALNVVVFFTDGKANTISAKYPTQGNCTSTTSDGTLDGWLTVDTASQTMGIFADIRVPINQESLQAIGGINCQFANYYNWTAIPNDSPYIPSTDSYGNSTFGYKSVTTYTSGPYNGQIQLTSAPDNTWAAADNAADNAATSIRTDPNTPAVIYTIALGDLPNDLPDATFLQRLANDPSSSNYNPAQPTGSYKYAPNASQLGALFNQVASEILALTQ